MEKIVLKTKSDVQFSYTDRNIGVKALNIDFQIKDVSETVYKQFQLINSNGAEEEILIEAILRNDPSELSTFLYYLENMKRFGIVNRSILDQRGVIASLISSSTLFDYKSDLFDTQKKYILSRFIVTRRKDTTIFIESPLGFGCLEIYTPELIGIIYSFTTPLGFDELLQLNLSFDEFSIKEILNFLCNIEGLSEVDESGVCQEDQDQALRQWEFHNLLFHSRSRMGRHNNPSGASFPFMKEIEPTPAIKPIDLKGKVITDLYTPDIENLKLNDIPFTKVLEDRRSIRRDIDPVVTLKQLGEFLYRSSRVREIHPINDEQGQYYETSNRPYPSGGSSYELELYIIINKCDGLEKGIYYYKPDSHQLIKMSSDENYVNAMLSDAWLSAAKIVKPQVLITISSRFQRLNWKYRSMGYSASVKNVGVLYQTMYLVATAMKLSPCALGNGNGDLLGKAVNLDYTSESALGEFILGA